jgi:hypothetical protein
MKGRNSFRSWRAIDIVAECTALDHTLSLFIPLPLGHGENLHRSLASARKCQKIPVEEIIFA